MSKTITHTITSNGEFSDVIDALRELEQYNAESVSVTVTFTLKPEEKLKGSTINFPKYGPLGPFGSSYAGGF